MPFSHFLMVWGVGICLIIFFKNLASCRFKHHQNFLEADKYQKFWGHTILKYIWLGLYCTFLSTFQDYIMGSMFAEPQSNVCVFWVRFLLIFKLKKVTLAFVMDDDYGDDGYGQVCWRCPLHFSILKVSLRENISIGFERSRRPRALVADLDIN